MKQIRLTSGKFALVDDEDYKYLNQWKWSFDGSNYARRALPARDRINNKQGKLWMHRIIMHPPEGLEIDHLNGNGLDNRKSNLRIVTHHINLLNLRVRKDSKSKLRGIFYTKYKTWVVKLGFNYKRIYIGSFKRKELAINAYKLATEKYYQGYEK